MYWPPMVFVISTQPTKLGGHRCEAVDGLAIHSHLIGRNPMPVKKHPPPLCACIVTGKTHVTTYPFRGLFPTKVGYATSC
jgi:hypothetical protein